MFARASTDAWSCGRRVADQSRAVADNQRHAMAEVLELTQLAQRHRMAEMDIGRRGVDAEFDIELSATLEFLEKQAFGHERVDS